MIFKKQVTLRVGFEPTRENPSDNLSYHIYMIQVRRLNHSAITARLGSKFQLLSILFRLNKSVQS